MVLPFFCRAGLIPGLRGLEEAKNRAGKCPPPDSDPFSDAEFAKNLVRLSIQKAATTNSRFEFKKSSQLFIRTHNETFSVRAMCVFNQIIRPSRVTAETQPQLQPALLILSAMISQ
jgi:hypothetical protein